MRNHKQAEVREARRLLVMLSTKHVRKAYLNNSCLPRAP